MAIAPFSLGRLAPFALASAALLLPFAAAAQQAGEVEFSRGVGFAQTPGQIPRTLGRGLPLREGDRLTTSDGASAIIKLQDGTRMTVRPNSELVLSQYQFKENDSNNSMVMQLLRGGLRAVTGVIAKNSPNAARIQTNTATIGIRGTDFDARVCSADCGAEGARIAERGRPNAIQASAKVVNARGDIAAVDAGGNRRRLVDGGSIYPGELVETAAASNAILAFRDESRVTLGGSTRFRVDNFVFDDKNPGEGRFLVSLLRGSVRALTGLIGKANTRNVALSTSTATIGIRGTGFDVSCTGACAREAAGAPTDGLTAFTWLGSITLSPNDGAGPSFTALQILQEGQGLIITPQGLQAITLPPNFDGTRPDGVTIPPNLFGGPTVSENTEGLFLFVRNGHIEIRTASELLQLGNGEAGFAGTAGNTARPVTIPKFIEFDQIPLPQSVNPALRTVLSESGVKTAAQCN